MGPLRVVGMFCLGCRAGFADGEAEGKFGKRWRVIFGKSRNELLKSLGEGELEGMDFAFGVGVGGVGQQPGVEAVPDEVGDGVYEARGTLPVLKSRVLWTSTAIEVGAVVVAELHGSKTGALDGDLGLAFGAAFSKR